MPDLFEGTNLVPVGVDHRVETLAGAALTVDVGAGAADGPWKIVGFGVAAHGTVGLERRQGDRILRQAAVDPYSPTSSRLRADRLAFLAYDHPEDAPAGGGVFRYRPQTGFVGVDYFWFEIGNPGQSRALGWVEIRVWGVNRAPVAAGQLVVVAGDGPVTIDVLAAASDPDGDRLRLTDLTLPAHGRLQLNADQTLTYTPGASFADHDSFGYRIRDLRTAGDSQVGHAEAQVTLRRPPVVVPPNIAPIAGRDRATTTQNTPVDIPILANDLDPDAGPDHQGPDGEPPLRVAGLAIPRHGLVALNPDQSITYTPDADFTGIDDLVYVIEDARGGTARGVVAIDVVE